MVLMGLVTGRMAHRVVEILIGLVDDHVAPFLDHTKPFPEGGLSILYLLEQMAGVNVVELVIGVIVQQARVPTHVCGRVVHIDTDGFGFDLHVSAASGRVPAPGNISSDGTGSGRFPRGVFDPY